MPLIGIDDEAAEFCSEFQSQLGLACTNGHLEGLLPFVNRNSQKKTWDRYLSFQLLALNHSNQSWIGYGPSISTIKRMGVSPIGEAQNLNKNLMLKFLDDLNRSYSKNTQQELRIENLISLLPKVEKIESVEFRLLFFGAMARLGCCIGRADVA